MNDITEFVIKALNGDRAAFDSLYEQTKGGVWFTCISLLKNEENAKDIMQDTYLAAFDNLGTLENPAAFRTWLNKIAANKCKNFISAKANSTLASGSEEILENVPDDKFLPEEYVIDAEKRRIIMDIIEDALSVNQYRTIVLYYFDEMTVAEIAELMDCHEKTVQYRLKTSRIKIKEEITRYEEENRDKLHAIAPFVLLTQLFRACAENASVPNVPIKLKSSPNTQTNVPSNAAASAAKQGGKTMLKSLKAKVIAGVCAAVVVGGGVTAGVLVLKNSDKRPAVSVASTPTVSKPAEVSKPAVSSIPTVSTSEVVSKPEEPSEPEVSTSEVVSKPEEPSEPEVSEVDYYGKAVEGDFEYQYLVRRNNKIDQSAAMITKYTGSEEKVTIPSTIGGKPVKRLKDTFEYNKTITEVTIPDSVIYLDGVFNGCRSLTKVNFLGAPRLIGGGAFADCKALEYIELPDGVEKLGYSVFDGSKNLKTVIFPDSVRSLEKGAFRRCSEHIEVHYKGKIYTKKTVDELYELCPFEFDPND